MGASSTGPHQFSGLLDELARAKSSAPIGAIESLIEAGDSAVQPLVDLLEAIEPDEDDWTPLWIAVTLGELRSPRSTSALLKLLALREGDVLAEAAVEALAKIGVPAFPSLSQFAREAREWEARHYAYAAIGLIPSEESRRFLTEALTTDVLLTSSIAGALANLGDPQALPVLRGLLNTCEKQEVPVVREAVDILEGRHPPDPKMHQQNWRTRYSELLAT